MVVTGQERKPDVLTAQEILLRMGRQSNRSRLMRTRMAGRTADAWAT
jgi:hypothetical protein